MTPPENPVVLSLVTAVAATGLILALIFREQTTKLFTFLAGIIWRAAIIPLGIAVPAVGWWVVLVGGEVTGWWTADPMPPTADFDGFCLWTAVGLASYMFIGRSVKIIWDAVRDAWKDAQPDSPPAVNASSRRDGGGGGAALNPNSVYFRALEERVRVIEAKVAANTKSLNTRSRNQSKVKQRLDELEARLNLLKGDAPNDGEEV